MTKPAIKRYSNLPGQPPSVTSILDAAWPKPELQEWFVTTTAELARKYRYTPIDQLLMRHGPRGAVRGTAVHKLIAAKLNGLGEPKRVTDEAEVMYVQWARWWDSEERPECRAEVTVSYSVGTMAYAGTADAIAQDEGDLWDWKTASTLPDWPWSEHVAQVAAYAHAVGDPFPEAHVVYIALDSVRAFAIAPDELAAAWQAFLSCYSLAYYLYPDQMRDVDADS